MAQTVVGSTDGPRVTETAGWPVGKLLKHARAGHKGAKAELGKRMRAKHAAKRKKG